MNRQTLAVTFGTLALIVIGAILLYASPAPTPPPGAAPGAAPARPVAAKAKAGQPPKKLTPTKLVHESPVPDDRPAAPAGAPNVVAIFVSSQRRDYWSMYGGPKKTTPFLDARAAEGVVLTDALTVSPDPRLAAAALVTGRYPHHVGAVELSEKRNHNALASEADTLAERFAAAGWLTVGATANHHYNHKLGQAQGFDWYRDSQPFSLMLDQRIGAGELVQAALQRVRSRSDAEKQRPLYLQLAFVDSHKPFRVPPSEFKAFDGDNAPYQATIRRTDDAVERLVEGLEGQGITQDDTVFLVVAEHGEGLEMPKHHRKQHGLVLYESSVGVPWVMWGRGLSGGRRVPGLASSIDVAPTLLALAGLDAAGLDGLDLGAAMKGEAPRTQRTEAYADTLYEGVHRASLWTAERQCQKDYGSKAVEDDVFETTCYDRKADPEFTKGLQDDALMARLEAQHAELIEAAGGQ